MIHLDVDVHDSFNSQALFAASVNVEQCMTVPHQTFASFSHDMFAFYSRSGVNPALKMYKFDRELWKI